MCQPPVHHLLTVFLAAQLILQFTGIAEATGAEPTTRIPALVSKPAQPAQTKDPGSVTALNYDIDEVHDIIEEDILDQAIRLDNFFGAMKSDIKHPTRYELSWNSFIRQEFGGALKFGSTLHANVVLSKINERLRLSISGEKKPEPFSPSLPEDPGNPGFSRQLQLQTTNIVNTELRYGIYQSPAANIFLGAGIRLVIPPQVFVRNRYEYTYHLTDITLIRGGETLFVNNASGVGESTEVALERSLGHHTLLRWANTGTVSQEFKGLEWGSDLSLIHELCSKSAITLSGGVFGNTSFDDEISNYRIQARYRRNFLRSWLFAELVPEISWPRRDDGTFATKYAITFLIEVVFQGEASGGK